LKDLAPLKIILFCQSKHNNFPPSLESVFHRKYRF
jgi:hypothetical protein